MKANIRNITFFVDTFILFMKEREKNQPYLSLKVDNTEILKVDENTEKRENNILDSSIKSNNTEILKIEE